MNTYKITLTSDTGKFTVKTIAQDEATARTMVIKFHNCPESAILKVIETPILYKVVKIGRISNRRQILHKHLTESEAQRVVRSYPDSSRSMVIYTRH